MNNKSLLKITVLASLIATISGCAKPLPSLKLVPEIRLAALPNIQENQSSGHPLKIFLKPGHNKDESAYLQKQFAKEMNQIITTAGSEVIDRGLAARLAKEIEFKQLNSDNFAPYLGPEVADYVVIATVTDSSWSSKYHERDSHTSKKGNTTVYPEKCEYDAKIKGTVEIRMLPSLKRIVSVNVKGSGSTKVENPRSRKCNEQSPVISALNEAIGSTFRPGDDNFMTLTKFIGAQGYITGAKIFDGQVYLETSLGRHLGATQDAMVKVYQMMDEELIEVAEGQILSNKNVLQSTSYIKVDQDVLPMIKRGMIVKLSGECNGWIKCVNASLKNMSH